MQTKTVPIFIIGVPSVYESRTEQNRTDCLFDINHTVSSQSHINITQ